MNNLPDIVIPHHNRYDLIGECLKNIPMDYKVFIVRGYHFAKACNKGASLSNSDRLIFLNDDVILTKEALEELVTHTEDIVGVPLLIPSSGKIVYGMNMYWGKYGNVNNLINSVKTQLSFEDSKYCQIPATGACFMIKRGVFNILDCLNEEYRNGGEDNELFLKAKEKGFTFGYINTVCTHLHSSSSGRYEKDVENHILLTKNFPEERLLKILGNDSINSLISVIIPTTDKDKEPFCLKFIKAQTYKNIEIIIIRDTERKGASWARNEGRKKAKGKFLFFCDNDIELKPIMLEVMMAKLRYTRGSFAYCNYDRKGELTGQVIGYPWNIKKLKNNNYISTMSLIKTRDFPVEGFDEDLERFQDWDLWLTMAEQEKYGIHINETLFTAYYKKGDISCNKLNTNKCIDIIKNKHSNFIKDKSMENKQDIEETKEETKILPKKVELCNIIPAFMNGDYLHIGTRNYPHIENTTDCFSVLPLENNSVEILFANNIIQKYNKLTIKNLLTEWFRVLEPFGKLIILSKDIKKIMGLFLQTYEEKYLNYLYGEQATVDDCYKYGYTENMIKKLLLEVGFENPHIVGSQEKYYNPQIDLIIETIKPKK